MNEPITVTEAADSIRSACLYCNDNAAPVGIESVHRIGRGVMVVVMYHGSNIGRMGRLQKFKVTIEPMGD